MDKKNDLKNQIKILSSLKNKVKKKQIVEFKPSIFNHSDNVESVNPVLDLSEDQKKEIQNEIVEIQTTYNQIKDNQIKKEKEVKEQMEETKVPCNELFRILKLIDREMIPCSDLFDDIKYMS